MLLRNPPTERTSPARRDDPADIDRSYSSSFAIPRREMTCRDGRASAENLRADRAANFGRWGLCLRALVLPEMGACEIFERQDAENQRENKGVVLDLEILLQEKIKDNL